MIKIDRSHEIIPENSERKQVDLSYGNDFAPILGHKSIDSIVEEERKLLKQQEEDDKKAAEEDEKKNDKDENIVRSEKMIRGELIDVQATGKNGTEITAEDDESQTTANVETSGGGGTPIRIKVV